MENLFKKLKELQGISSTNLKKEFIKANKNDILFNDTLFFLLNPYIVTNISKAKINKKVKVKSSREIKDLWDMYKFLEVECTGKDVDIATLQNFLETCKYKDEVKELITKSMRLGVQGKLVNTALGKEFIPQFGCMLGESYFKNKKKVKGSFILTTKLDGSRILIIKENGKVKCFSRQGQLIDGLIDIESELNNIEEDNFVIDGELIAEGDFENSADQYKETMKRSRIKGIKKGLKMVCYDYVENINDFKNKLCKTKCIDRKNKLKEILNRDLNFIEYLEPLYIGDDITKISEYSNKAVLHGDEGIMLSIADSPYECKRSKNLLKVKEFHDGEVLVTEIIEGTGKYINKLGAVKCQFKYNDKVYEVEVGSGWQDNERELLFNNPELILDKVISIRYFEISQNSTTGDYSLRFPTINLRYPDFIRTDKDGIEDTNID